jgi:putative ABC transport system permease protein
MWRLRVFLARLYGSIRAAASRVRGLLDRRRLDRDLDAELRSHLDSLILENVESGMSVEDAKAAARRSFGGYQQTKEAYRDQRGLPLVDALAKDVRYAARVLLKHPAFSAVAVLTLAFGIGANTAIFSLVNEVLLRPLPFADSDRLVMVWEDASFAGLPHNEPAPANFADWRSQNKTLEDMAALSWSNLTVTGDGEPWTLFGYEVTSNFFGLLGVRAALGRTFLPEDESTSANKVVMLSHGIWQKRYGGESSVIGRQILLNDEKYTVVGVMPATFQFLGGFIGFWTPLRYGPEMWANRDGHYLNVVARLKPGTSVDEAQADIQTITRRIARDFPVESYGGKLGALVLPLREQLAGESERQFVLLLVGVGIVLLIACANISSLLLARGASRRRELALRAALGASRGRITRQLLTESAVLALAGGSAGLIMAKWSFGFLEKLIPSDMTLSTSLKIDWRILSYVLAISLVTSIVFGLLPAIRLSKIELSEAIKQSGPRNRGGRENARLRDALVVIEVALALVLSIGSGLLIKTFANLQGQYSFLHPEQVLTMKTVLPRSKYPEAWQRVAFCDQTLERVSSIPGVVSAGYTTAIPLSWKGGTSEFSVEGRDVVEGLSYDAIHRQVTQNYLQTLGISLLDGRYFDDHDSARSEPVVIINQTLARDYWPNQSAIGKRLKLGDPSSTKPWLTVVGVVRDVRQMGIDAPVKAEMYLPHHQQRGYGWFTPTDLALRTDVEPHSLISAIKAVIHEVDPGQPVTVVMTLSELLGEETESRRLGTTLLAGFGCLAVLLAAIGIYGVLAYFVAQRVSEIGVRLALGARPSDVLRLVLGRGVFLTGVGAAIGLLASVALNRLFDNLLYGVSATDPVTFAATTLLLVGVGALACYIPARRASRVDPMTALRCE